MAHPRDLVLGCLTLIARKGSGGTLAAQFELLAVSSLSLLVFPLFAVYLHKHEAEPVSD